MMFVCLDDDVIHVHVDDDLQAELQTQASAPWAYFMKRDCAVGDMGPWRPPETVADKPD